jgi:predicted AlkP superfamily phosphohydrolase/phosphomutase
MLWGRFDRELLESYKLVDQALGRTLQKAGNATVIVMSDHGFTSFDRAVHLNSWLVQEGFKTQAYAVGLNGLYINLKGRERNGTVRPEERDAVMRKLKERLLLFRDPDTSKPVIDAVYTTNERVLPGAFEQAPDLIVGYHATFRASWETALGAAPKNIVEDNTGAWIGDHCVAAHLVPGVLLSNRQTQVRDPKLADLTVTLLAEFEVAAAPGMKGHVLFHKH